MPIKDRITIRFSNPQVLKDLRKIAEKKQIKLNKLVTQILTEETENIIYYEQK